jgi:hypothetical protein
MSALRLWSFLTTAVLAMAAAGCTTDAFCFGGCEGDAGTTADAHKETGTPPIGYRDSSLIITDTGQPPSDACVPTNGGNEICDHIDNDCNGAVDDGLLDKITSCGTCDNNCYYQLTHTLGQTCTPIADGIPGKCGFTSCEKDYYDFDGDPTNGCEKYCEKKADLDNTHNNLDDNCNGLIDEDVDLCNDPLNCGRFDRKCLAPNAVLKCTHTGDAGKCDETNTQCSFVECEADYYDRDNNLLKNGCEIHCVKTGPEICDNIDNDCDGLIDQFDPDLTDSRVGQACQGGTLGICGDAAAAGTTQCQNGTVVCQGNDVVLPGTKVETCNGLDDDCDGVVDGTLETGTPVACANDAACAGQTLAKVCRPRPGSGDSVCARPANNEGGSCGKSTGECVAGKNTCVAGKIQCVGKIDEVAETCNGKDDNCNGLFDDNPTDVGMDCNVPTPPPSGATSPCKKGTYICAAGTRTCSGFAGPTQLTDKCGEDSNCDGALTNQPDLSSDLRNCGSCGNDCTTKGGHGIWTCTTGKCVLSGCNPGYYDCNKDGNDCETQCSFNSTIERCNGADDNCDCNIDELKSAQFPNGIPPATPSAVCGVNAGATDPGCTGATVTCSSGTWKCTFPAGYCTLGSGNTCSDDVGAGSDVCDGKDNNCNGAIDEDFRHPVKTTGALDDACASDDANPGSQGVCRTTGKYVCNGPNATKCDAVPTSCVNCTETCDGLDNDCDGLVDEPFSNKGSNATNYVKPNVVKVRDNPPLFVFEYEASRPSATSQSSGSGNGYFTSAPPGTPFDKTPACSVPTKIPWFNVSAAEAKQVCTAAGGRLCRTSEWERSCMVNNATGGLAGSTTDNNCSWGYAGRTPACTTSSFTASGTCNLGAFDFDTTLSNGIQSGLLPTAYAGVAPNPPNPPGIANACYADWSSYNANASGSDKIFDITGNLRETTSCILRGFGCQANGDCCAVVSTTGGKAACLPQAAGQTAKYCSSSSGSDLPGQGCREIGAACTASGQCCNSVTCTNGYCGGCRTVGTACTLTSQCCDGVACTNGFCGGMPGTPGEVFPLMGGAYNTQAEAGAKCDFDFYTVDQQFKLFDDGFRCCFDSDPR